MAASKPKSIKRKDLQKLARLRLKEAEALYKKHLYDGAVYIAGYAVEFALKAKICRLLHLTEYPPSGNIGQWFKLHDLEQLKMLAGLTEEVTISKNKDLFDNWSKAVGTKKQRYEPAGKYNAVTAKVILDSIREKPNGVLTWLTKRW